MFGEEFSCICIKYTYMLWFKFILGLIFFELVPILFAIVSDYGNKYMTKEKENWTSLKNFAPKLNCNHNIYVKFYHKANKQYCCRYLTKILSYSCIGNKKARDNDWGNEMHLIYKKCSKGNKKA